MHLLSLLLILSSSSSSSSSSSFLEEKWPVCSQCLRKQRPPPSGKYWKCFNLLESARCRWITAASRTERRRKAAAGSGYWPWGSKVSNCSWMDILFAYIYCSELTHSLTHWYKSTHSLTHWYKSTYSPTHSHSLTHSLVQTSHTVFVFVATTDTCGLSVYWHITQTVTKRVAGLEALYSAGSSIWWYLLSLIRY